MPDRVADCDVRTAVILAGGKGSRMGSLTADTPKVMLPVAGKPILEHLLQEVREAGITDIVVVVGYLGGIIREYFGDGSKWGASIRYCIQTEQRGTADALGSARHLVGDRFTVLNGDVIVGSNELKHLISVSECAMGIVEQDDVTGLGVVELDEDRVIRIFEKTENPVSHCANAGVYVFTQDIFSAIDRTPKSVRGEYELTTAVQLMIDAGVQVKAHKIGQWIDFSYPSDLLRVNR